MIEITKLPLIHPVTIAVIGVHDGTKANFTTIGDIAVAGLQPPLIMISLNEKHFTQQVFKETKTCSINILNSTYLSQVDFAGVFSGKTQSKDTLFEYNLVNGVPIIKQSISSMVVTLNKCVQINKRVISICDVQNTFINEEYYPENKINFADANPILYGLDNVYYSKCINIGEGYHAYKNKIQIHK